MKNKRSSVFWLLLTLIVAAALFWPVWSLAQSVPGNGRLPASRPVPHTTNALSHTLFLPLALGGGEIVTTVVDMGKLDADSLNTETLARGDIHRWDVDVAATGTITVFATALPEDAVLVLRDSSGGILARQNGTGAGEVEMLAYTAVATGTYYVDVSEVGYESTHYALLLLDDDSYHFQPRGSLNYGMPVTTSLPANQDDFWHFLGSAGDQITITVTPDAASDPFFSVYDTNAAPLINFHDEGNVGETETISVTLDADGLYTIHTGEFDFGPMQYEIMVYSNSLQHLPVRGRDAGRIGIGTVKEQN